MVFRFFFYMKKDQREKRYFYKICRCFFKFLKLIFDRICIHPPRKRLGYIGLLLSVRSFVRPVVTLFRLSDTQILLGRGYLLVNFNYCTSVILIPLLSTDLTLLLRFPNLKEATK